MRDTGESASLIIPEPLALQALHKADIDYSTSTSTMQYLLIFSPIYSNLYLLLYVRRKQRRRTLSCDEGAQFFLLHILSGKYIKCYLYHYHDYFRIRESSIP
jgi:hypothetical protein